MGKQESRDHMNQKRILYEDQDIIVCHKAAGIATQTARVGQADMVSEIANYLSRAGKNAARNVHGSRGTQPYVKDLPEGCPFGPRCGSCTEECKGVIPVREIRGGSVRCIHAV